MSVDIFASLAEHEQQQRNKQNRIYAMLSEHAPRVPWDKFIREKLVWKPGEHFGMIGPTGQGKTTMLHNLLPLKPFVAVFATKPRDESMDGLLANGYVKMERWVSVSAEQYPKRVLWPPAGHIDSVTQQRAVFADAFDKIYREGGWTLAIDELWYFVNELKLGHPVKVMLVQARSLGISLIVGTQRPAFVPVEIYDQSTHLMFWRDNDERNLARLSGISWRSANIVKNIIANLDFHQVLYINTRTGEMYRTKCPAID